MPGISFSSLHPQNTVLVHRGIILYELGVYHIVLEDPALCLFFTESHLRCHPYLVPFDDQAVFRVEEESPGKYTLKLGPWLLVEEDVEALDKHDLVLLAVELDLVLLGVLLGVVEVGEAALAGGLGVLEVFHKSLCVKSELGSSPRVSVFWVLHLVQLMPVVVVAVHGHNQCLDVEVLFENPLDLLAEEALARGAGPRHPNERHAACGVLYH